MSRARRTAALWAARRMDPAFHDEAGFEAWKSDDPANAQAFDQVWGVNQDSALTEAMRLSEQRRAAGRRRAGPIAALAGGVLACGLAVALAWPQLQLMTVTPVAFETARGEHRAIALADGTKVVLDGDTRLEVRLGVGRREVALSKGEAFFDVAHDEARPFTVKTAAGSARVLGTAFDLEVSDERGPERLELSVHRGRVRLAPDGLIRRTAVLTPGQRAFATEGRLSKVRTFDPSADDWRSGWLETDGVSLGRLVERLNRASDRRIVIADTELARQRVAGRFRMDEPAALVRNLALVHGFEVREGQGGLVLSR
ncbi:FecR family protein [Caulobacter endophyticus]|uniref:Iron dicitrate transport regulator FecR n=1 Tax=Caulobacter endophyticus TaxID=2172652 RepID=A0A2T9JTW0_9CAUL|nr:FecR domain-containing protein [Caulobacter endophyticus]PVM87147.1 iron dicitrate transport regulator FecR [Caulobacter endophyticus]